VYGWADARQDILSWPKLTNNWRHSFAFAHSPAGSAAAAAGVAVDVAGAGVRCSVFATRSLSVFGLVLAHPLPLFDTGRSHAAPFAAFPRALVCVRENGSLGLGFQCVSAGENTPNSSRHWKGSSGIVYMTMLISFIGAITWLIFFTILGLFG